ncbi:hypothetical protein [Streptomyces sp. CBMA156]|uniref:hypothetical protein n=1 Tax=Streptomyces sp. CBMA156 TaxID=1930280 RepID=UPI001661A4E9|nr:hypothetical protein [Streptomyces sp. CBMA156]MBD0671388.1 hypothetical protein [Streptomyces sp. CBMA156]
MSASAERDRRPVLPRRLGAADAAPYRAFRLAALRESPSAFTSSHAEEAGRPLSATLRRLAEAEDGPAALGGCGRCC